MSTEKNKAIVRRLFKELNKGNLKAMDEIFSSNFVNHHPGPGLKSDREGLKQFIAGMHVTFPDYRWNIEDIIAEGDKVVYRLTLHGTDTGGFMGMPPTGKHVVVEAIGIQRFSEGQVVERWNISDGLGMFTHLGLLPTLG